MPLNETVYTEVEQPVVVVHILQPINSLVEYSTDTLQVVACDQITSVAHVTEETVSVLQPIDEVTQVIVYDPVVQVVLPANITINEAEETVNDENVVCEMVLGANSTVNRVVAVQADGTIVHADKDNANHACDVIGVLKQSGITGQLVQVVKFGKLTGASLGAIGDNFFLGNDGQIVTTPPTTGFWLSIGTQMAASEFFVSIKEPIDVGA